MCVVVDDVTLLGHVTVGGGEGIEGARLRLGNCCEGGGGAIMACVAVTAIVTV